MQMPLRYGLIARILSIRLAERWGLDDIIQPLSQSIRYLETCRRASKNDETNVTNAYAQNLFDYVNDTRHVTPRNRVAHYEVLKNDIIVPDLIYIHALNKQHCIRDTILLEYFTNA